MQPANEEKREEESGSKQNKKKFWKSKKGCYLCTPKRNGSKEGEVGEKERGMSGVKPNRNSKLKGAILGADKNDRSKRLTPEDYIADSDDEAKKFF